MDEPALNTIGAALSTLRSIVGLARDVNKIELTDKILELQGQILDIQSKFAHLQDQNISLRQENRELKQMRDVEDTLVFEHYVYWTKRADGNQEGPFCTRCWDHDKKLVRLLPTMVMGVDNGHRCPVDGTQYVWVDT